MVFADGLLRPNKALHLTGDRPALRLSSRSLSLMNTCFPSGPAGELGRSPHTEHLRQEIAHSHRL